MSAGKSKGAQVEWMWAEMFSPVTGSQFPDFQIVASLGIVEINTGCLIIYNSLALTSEITVWQIPTSRGLGSCIPSNLRNSYFG